MTHCTEREKPQARPRNCISEKREGNGNEVHTRVSSDQFAVTAVASNQQIVSDLVDGARAWKHLVFTHLVKNLFFFLILTEVALKNYIKINNFRGLWFLT